jgi:hypothetical protein
MDDNHEKIKAALAWGGLFVVAFIIIPGAATLLALCLLVLGLVFLVLIFIGGFT